ncbi:MAG TPA: hypothetical protein VNJ01_10235 [Bacteriovoracaceae bacterium]|nr:hypothetical protein [Bacteriovoracaceae bacterium]
MNTFCSFFNLGTCRSCDLISLGYPQQLEWKQQQLTESLKHFSPPPLLPPVSSNLVSFRNKAKLVVTGTLSAPVIGLLGEENLDTGRELLSCPLHFSEMNSLLLSLKTFITDARLEPYRISERTGELKGLIVFYSQRSRELYLRFVLRSRESLDRIKKHSPSLLRDHPGLLCVSANIQPVAHAILEGEEEIILSEKSFIDHDLGTVRYHLGPRGFVQTNQSVSELLYQTAADWMKELGRVRLVELFSGQGAFSFFAAPFIEEGLGVEINPAAVKQAEASARALGLPQLRFQCADAKDVSAVVREFGPELILVNPPRKGLGEAVEILLGQAPTYLIYSSCNHQTLSRDLAKLQTEYLILRVQLFDMFPHTRHFETLVLLQKRSL